MAYNKKGYAKRTYTKETKARATGPSITNPTSQQVDILSAVKRGESCIVQAYAGCGKTSTLEYITWNHSVPSLYVAFNKSTVVEAEGRMPTWVTCSTIHSLAYQAIVGKAGKFPDLAKGLETFYNYSRISDFILDNKLWLDKDSLHEVTSDVCEVIKKYASDSVLNMDELLLEWEGNDREVRVRIAQEVYLAQLDGRLGVTFDAMLKAWQLDTSIVYPKYEVVYLDESQDSNAITLDCIASKFPTAQIVLVGDPYQAIYAWRGAVNGLSDPRFAAFTKLPLSVSWRLPPDVAEQANVILSCLGATVPLVGKGSTVEVDTRCSLYRSNARLIKDMLLNAMNGVLQYVDADLDDLWSMVYTMHRMKAAHYSESPIVDWPKSPHKAVKSYGTWDNLVSRGTPDVKRVAKLVSEGFGHSDIELIKGTLVTSQRKADVILLTIHKCKGHEYSEVIIGKDALPVPYVKSGTMSKEELTLYIIEQGLNLLYVALTRAKVRNFCDPEVTEFLGDLPSLMEVLKDE